MTEFMALAKTRDATFRIVRRCNLPLLARISAQGQEQLVIPAEHGLRHLLMQEMHITPTAGHLGMRKMCHALFERVWWPKLRAEVAEFVGKCDVCIRTKDATTRAKGLLQPLPIPPARFTSWSIDFTTGLRLSGGFNAIMTCVDRLT